jgi:hypothetical protein
MARVSVARQPASIWLGLGLDERLNKGYANRTLSGG